MPEFQSVSAAEFDSLLASAPQSAAFRQQYARFEPSLYDGWNGPDFRVYRGDLIYEGDLRAPGLATLVIGEVTISGCVDLSNDASQGFDEGGLFVALGSVHCRVFSGWYGKCTFVDGDLTAEDMLLNAYEDSSLVVTGDLKTRFFFGQDIQAEVGGRAEMIYGDGYATPLGGGARRGFVRPRHDEATSLALLAEDDPEKRRTAHYHLRRALKGLPLFR